MQFLSKLLPITYRATIIAPLAVAVFVASTASDPDAVNANNHPIKVVSVAFSEPDADNVWHDGTNLDITVTLNQATTVDSGLFRRDLVPGTGRRVLLPTKRIQDRPGLLPECQRHQRARVPLPHRRSSTNPCLYPREQHAPRQPRPGSYLNTHPRYIRTSDTHAVAGPTVTGITINEATSNGFWNGGDQVDINVTFRESVSVNSSRPEKPYITVIQVMESEEADGKEFQYRTSSGTDTITFSRTVPAGAGPRRAFELLADQIRHGGVYIVATDDKALADLSHPAYQGITALAAPCWSNPNDLWCARLTVAAETGTDSNGSRAGESGCRCVPGLFAGGQMVHGSGSGWFAFGGAGGRGWMVVPAA